jgi:hypothetical protein
VLVITSIKLLTLTLSAKERMTQQPTWVNELRAAQARLAQAMAKLAEAQGRRNGRDERAAE